MTDALELVGSATACEIFGINRSTLTRWVEAGKIKPLGRIGGAFVFSQDEIDRRQRETA